MTTIARKRIKPAYRVEVTRRHETEKPFGWLVYRRGELNPIARSESGYADEAAAWNAGASAMDTFVPRKSS